MESQAGGSARYRTRSDGGASSASLSAARHAALTHSGTATSNSAGTFGTETSRSRTPSVGHRRGGGQHERQSLTDMRSYGVESRRRLNAPVHVLMSLSAEEIFKDSRILGAELRAIKRSLRHRHGSPGAPENNLPTTTSNPKYSDTTRSARCLLDCGWSSSSDDYAAEDDMDRSNARTSESSRVPRDSSRVSRPSGGRGRGAEGVSARPAGDATRLTQQVVELEGDYARAVAPAIGIPQRIPPSLRPEPRVGIGRRRSPQYSAVRQGTSRSDATDPFPSIGENVHRAGGRCASRDAPLEHVIRSRTGNAEVQDDFPGHPSGQRPSRRRSELRAVSARLDAAATAIYAVEAGVRSTSNRLDSFQRLLDSHPAASTLSTGATWGDQHTVVPLETETRRVHVAELAEAGVDGSSQPTAEAESDEQREHFGTLHEVATAEAAVSTFGTAIAGTHSVIDRVRSSHAERQRQLRRGATPREKDSWSLQFSEVRPSILSVLTMQDPEPGLQCPTGSSPALDARGSNCNHSRRRSRESKNRCSIAEDATASSRISAAAATTGSSPAMSHPRDVSGRVWPRDYSDRSGDSPAFPRIGGTSSRRRAVVASERDVMAAPRPQSIVTTPLSQSTDAFSPVLAAAGLSTLVAHEERHSEGIVLQGAEGSSARLREEHCGRLSAPRSITSVSDGTGDSGGVDASVQPLLDSVASDSAALRDSVVRDSSGADVANAEDLPLEPGLTELDTSPDTGVSSRTSSHQRSINWRSISNVNGHNEDVSFESVLREFEAVVDRGERRVVSTFDVAVARGSNDNHSTAPVFRSPTNLIMESASTTSWNRTEERNVRTENVRSAPDQDSADGVRTVSSDVDNLSHQEVELEAAMNSLDQERDQLMLEIARLRNQQNETLLHLLRLQQEQIVVRRRQVATLSDIVNSFGRTVDAAWALPHGEDSSLGRISGAVVSTLRRMLGVLLATVPQVDARTSASSVEDHSTIGGSLAFAAALDMEANSALSTDSATPVTSSGDLLQISAVLGAGFRPDTSTGRSIPVGMSVSGGPRATPQRPAEYLTQQAIDAALEALPRLASAAEAISSARRLRRLGRNGTLTGRIAEAGDDAIRGCSAATIAALPDAEPQSVDGCVICLSEGAGVAGDKLCRLPCEHVFHRICVGKWLSVQASCPTCRREVPNVSGQAVVTTSPVVPGVG